MEQKIIQEIRDLGKWVTIMSGLVVILIGVSGYLVLTAVEEISCR